jgi:hypothetical protein
MSNNNKRASKEMSGCVGSKKKKQLQQVASLLSPVTAAASTPTWIM